MADCSAESLLEYNEIVMKMFSSEEDGFQFYNEYAFNKGFSVRKGSVEWNTANTEIIKRKLYCSAQGFREEKHLNKEKRKRQPRPLSRDGCLAKLVIAVDKMTRKWYVKDFIDEHNHPLCPRDLSCLLRSHRRISDEQKADIVEMKISSIRTHQIMDILEMQYGGYDNVGFTTRDIYNFIYRYKQESIAAGDAKSVILHLNARQARDPEFYFKYMVDKEGHLNGLFWCDSQSRLDYEAFGDVVVFDSTYKTNRYNLPFVPFVGLNHHRSTVIFGCGVISHETSESYEWLLRTFSAAMTQRHPMSVITDGDLAMQKAIKVVWPNANHRLCVWHIEQNIFRNLGTDDVKADFRKFLYDTCTIEEIERKWEVFLQKYKVTTEESWLYQMYQMRNLWCAAYQVGRCFLGLRSNQRSESLNSRLHTHLDRKMTLFDMLRHYEHCLSGIRRNEAILDVVGLVYVPFTLKDASKIEKDAARLFTPTVFEMVRFSIHAASKNIIREIVDGGDLITYVVTRKDNMLLRVEVKCQFIEDSLDHITCSCLKLQCMGTPCSHIFYVLGLLDIERMPKCIVPERWTMRAKSAFPPLRKSNMYEFSEILRRYRDLRNLSHAAAFRASHSYASYARLRRALIGEASSNEGGKEGVTISNYAPEVPLTMEADCEEVSQVLDPINVPGRGAPKKSAREVKNAAGKTKCGLCNLVGHNRRTCMNRKKRMKPAENSASTD